MPDSRDRLELNAAILALIDEHRRRSGNPDLGSGVERAVLESEWRDLEKDIYDNPGALERNLAPLRRRERAGGEG